MQNIVPLSVHTIITQNTFDGTEGDGKVSQLDIRGVAAGAVKTLTESGHMGKTYTLTGPEALSNPQIAAPLTKMLTREISFVNLPPAH